MNDENTTTIGDRLVDLALAVGNLHSTAILTAFWYVVLVAVAVYSLYLAAVYVRNSLPRIGILVRRACSYLRGQK